MTTILYILRHGEYENPRYLYPGNSDEFSLSERGRAQISQTAKYFYGKPIVALLSSPVLRTRQSAGILSSVLNLSIECDDRLREVQTGLEGMSMAEFDKTMGELSYLPEYQAKGAESMESVASRMGGFLREKAARYEGKEAIVVTHGDPMRFGILAVTGRPISFSESQKIAIPLAGGYRIVFRDVNEAKVYPIVIS